MVIDLVHDLHRNYAGALGFSRILSRGESIDEVFNGGPALQPCLSSSFFFVLLLHSFHLSFSIPVPLLSSVSTPPIAMKRNSDIRRASIKPHRFRSMSASSINRAFSLYFTHSFSFLSLCTPVLLLSRKGMPRTRRRRRGWRTTCSLFAVRTPAWLACVGCTHPFSAVLGSASGQTEKNVQ